MVTKKQKAPLQAVQAPLTPQRFIIWNKWLAGIYALQAIALAVVAVGKPLPVQTSFFAEDPMAGVIVGEKVTGVSTQHLFDLNVVAVLVAALAIFAITHGLMATVGRRRYEAELTRGVNSWRWAGYSLAAGLLLVAIAMLVGVAHAAIILCILGATLIGGIAGLLAEVLRRYGLRKPKWIAYSLSCVSVLAPGLIIAATLIAANVYDGTVGAYLYGVYATIVVLFAGVGVVQYRALKAVGKTLPYLAAERAWMLVGLVATTAVVWQVFFGALRP